MSIEIGSELRFEPMGADELAHPVIQDLVALCERQKQPHCRDRITGIETRTKFARPRETTVVTLVMLKGLEGGRRYEVRFRLFDPRGEMRSRATVAYDLSPSLPEGFDLKVRFSWPAPDPLNWELGRWRVEIAINGNVEGERTFEVVEWGGATTAHR